MRRSLQAVVAEVELMAEQIASPPRELRDKTDALFWPSTSPSPDEPANQVAVAPTDVDDVVEGVARLSGHCSWCKCQACAFCQAGGAGDRPSGTGRLGGEQVKSFVAAAAGSSSAEGSSAHAGGGSRHSPAGSEEGPHGNHTGHHRGDSIGDEVSESVRRLSRMALSGAGAGLALLICVCACCGGRNKRRRTRRGYGRTRGADEVLLPCVVEVDGGVTHTLALDIDGVDSLSRLRSLLAEAYMDVSGEPLVMSSIEIEVEEIEGAGFLPVDSSKALRRGRLQRARSLRASALVDAAAIAAMAPKRSKRVVGGGRTRV